MKSLFAYQPNLDIEFGLENIDCASYQMVFGDNSTIESLDSDFSFESKDEESNDSESEEGLEIIDGDNEECLEKNDQINIARRLCKESDGTSQVVHT